jgi:membrane protease YdiL (CAAX protease family)
VDQTKTNISVFEYHPPAYGEVKVKRLVRIASPTKAIVVGIVLFTAAVAEIATMVFNVVVGATIDGVLLFTIVNVAFFSRSDSIRKILIPLLLVPLLRILSLAIPIPHIMPIFWYLLVGVPLLIATFIVVRVIGLPALSLRQSFMKWFLQILFGLLGIPIGILAAYLLSSPSIMIPGKTIGWIISGAIILTLCSALIEEIIFRGLVQNVTLDSYGLIGLLISSGVYAIMTVGTLSPGYVIFFGITGLLFSLWVKISGSLWGVILAHCLVNIIFLLLLAH